MADAGSKPPAEPGGRLPRPVGVAEGEHLPGTVEDPVAAAVGGGHRRGDGRALGAGRAVVGGVAEGVDGAGARDHPVAVAGGVGHDGDGRPAAAADARAGPLEPRVTEGEDAAVRGDHEVAVAIGGGHHPHDGCVEAVRQARAGGMQAATGDGTVEARIAEGEDAAVGGDEPVAAPVGRGGDADDGALEMQRAGGAVELGRPEAEDAAVRSHQPVPVRRRGRRWRRRWWRRWGWWRVR